MLRARIRWLALVLTMAVGVGAGADSAEADGAGGHRHGGLRVKRQRDIIIVAVAGAAYVSSEFLKDQLTPGHCRWCAGNGLDDGARDAVLWDKTSRANTLSNLTGYALLPGVALGLGGLAAAHDDRFGGWLDDAIVITGAAVVAGNLNQLTKFLVMRERPFQHALAPADKSKSHDANLSFYSGHTTLAFSLAVGAGTVASIRGYRWRGLIWASGLTLAVATGYLRMAADKHYLSDVLVRAVTGAGLGWGIPMLRRRCPSMTVAATPLQSGALVGVGMTF